MRNATQARLALRFATGGFYFFVAYKKTDLEKQSLAAIKKNELVFIEEVVSFLPCSKSTFYSYKLDESDAIKSEIEKNKVNRKLGLRNKMYNAENPTAWVALYKLIGTDEEAERLNGSKQKHELTGANGGAIETMVILPKIDNDSDG